MRGGAIEEGDDLRLVAAGNDNHMFKSVTQTQVLQIPAVNNQSTNTNGTMQFICQSGIGSFVDISESYVSFRVQLRRANAPTDAFAPLTASTTLLAPGVLFPHKLFSSVRLSINGTQCGDPMLDSQAGYPFAALAQQTLFGPSASYTSKDADLDFWYLNPVDAVGGAQAGDFFSAAQEMVAPTINRPTTARQRQQMITLNKATTAAGDWYTVIFRPKTTLFGNKKLLPDNLTIMLELVVDQQKKQFAIIGNGLTTNNGAAPPVDIPANSGLAPYVAFDINSAFWNVPVKTIAENELAEINMTRNEGIPRTHHFLSKKQSTTSVTATQGQISNILPGVTPDTLWIACVPTAILQGDKDVRSVFAGAAAAADLGWGDSFTTLPLTEEQSSNGNGAFLQVATGGRSFPINRLDNHKDAYAHYLNCCGSADLGGNGTPPMTYKQWLKTPVYALSLRADGECMIGRASDDTRVSAITLNYKFQAGASAADAPLAAGGKGVSIIMVGFSHGAIDIKGQAVEAYGPGFQ